MHHVEASQAAEELSVGKSVLHDFSVRKDSVISLPTLGKPGRISHYTSEQIGGAIRVFLALGEAVDAGIYASVRESRRDIDPKIATLASDAQWKSKFTLHSFDAFCEEHQERNSALTKETILDAYKSPYPFFLDLQNALRGNPSFRFARFFSNVQVNFSLDDISPGWQAMIAEFGAYDAIGFKCAQVFALLREKEKEYHSIAHIEKVVSATIIDLTFHNSQAPGYYSRCPAHVLVPDQVLFAAGINFVLYDNNPDSLPVSIVSPDRKGFRSHEELARAYEAQIQS